MSRRVQITDSAKPKKRAQLSAHTFIRQMLDDPTVNDLLARFIETSQELDRHSAEDESTVAASYWTVDVYMPGDGRYQISFTRLDREGPHEKAVRFRGVLRRIATIAGRYDSPADALEVIVGMAEEAVRGEMP